MLRLLRPLLRRPPACVQLALMAPLENLPAPPRFAAAFWVLLLVLPMLVLVPLSMARSAAPGFGGALAMMTTLFVGNLVLLGPFVQALTLQMYWNEVSMLLSGCCGGREGAQQNAIAQS